jgi:hypothetical protein
VAEYRVAWLDEHLAFAVPMRIAEIVARVRAMPPSLTGLSFEDRVRNVLTDATGYQRGASSAASGLPALIATMGDALFGQSAPGRAGQVMAAFTTALACGALLSADGITYREHHWCARIHDNCPRGDAA